MRLTCLSILVCLMVTACGTKGPLYIPEQQYPQDVQPKDIEQKPAPQK
jgi:predicted small lipoprotein YifL